MLIPLWAVFGPFSSFMMRVEVIFWGFIANMNSCKTTMGWMEGDDVSVAHNTQKVIFKFRSWFTIKKASEQAIEKEKETKVCKWKWNFLRLKKQFDEKFLLSWRRERMAFYFLIFHFLFFRTSLLLDLKGSGLFSSSLWKIENLHQLFVFKPLSFTLKNSLTVIRWVGWCVWRLCMRIFIIL